MNASLFATEGIASVGPIWAPLSALVCGLVISVGNSVTKGLPQRFVLISGSISAITLLSVPLSVTLLSHGMGLLFLIWYAMPRPMADNREQMPVLLRIRRVAALPVYTIALVLLFLSDLLGYLGAVIAGDPR
jgi:membrane glycosyltransferase